MTERYRVQIRSNPPGALVKRLPDGTVMGQTPFTCAIDRAAPKVTFVYTMDGYEDQARDVDAAREEEVYVKMKPIPGLPAKRW